MSYKVIGHIEVPEANTKDPQNNGLVKQKYALDLKVIGDAGELDSDAIIAAGLAFKVRSGFKDAAGNVVVLFEGKGQDGDKVFPPGSEHEGYAVPAPGYTLDGPGISAIEHSNGLRFVQNFKGLPDGCYTAFAEVFGAGVATFPKGDTICVGAAKARKGQHP